MDGWNGWMDGWRVGRCSRLIKGCMYVERVTDSLTYSRGVKKKGEGGGEGEGYVCMYVGIIQE